jgi:glycosyltransferase involved in cell wall biosynthesis
MKILAFLQMHNEVESGNLVRCLDNCKRWADDIVIYDDASTDSSIEVASKYTTHILRGAVNNIREELFHKQQLLQYALTLQPDWIMWLDCDEILDRNGTNGGLRKLAESASPDIQAFGFAELQLWRSETYYRTDGLFSTQRFIRLWRVVPDMNIATAVGLDLPSYPRHIKKFTNSVINVIHYHFCDYKRMLWHAGLGNASREELQKIALNHFIIDERPCVCKKVPIDWFPAENIPSGTWPEPKSVALCDIKSYCEL